VLRWCELCVCVRVRVWLRCACGVRVVCMCACGVRVCGCAWVCSCVVCLAGASHTCIATAADDHSPRRVRTRRMRVPRLGRLPTRAQTAGGEVPPANGDERRGGSTMVQPAKHEGDRADGHGRVCVPVERCECGASGCDGTLQLHVRGARHLRALAAHPSSEGPGGGRCVQRVRLLEADRRAGGVGACDLMRVDGCALLGEAAARRVLDKLERVVPSGEGTCSKHAVQRC
jgi:hypothetical protein